MVRGLLRGLVAEAANGDVFPLLVPADGAAVPDEVAGQKAFPVVAVPRRPGPVHFGVELARAVARLGCRPDLVFSVTHGPARSPVPSVLMVTDLSFWRHPELYPRPTRARLNILVRHQARGAALVTTISDFCRGELVEAYGLDESRAAVVPLVVDDPAPFDDDARREGEAWLEGRGVRRPFVLYLGNLHPRKNVGRLIQAFRRARDSGELAGHQLVLAGGQWWSGGNESEEAARAGPGAVVVLGRVTDRRREQLLRIASALAYVSVYEGFGLPPLEAMARGTPVLAARAGALPETLGDAAVLVDPLDVDAIAGGLVDVATDTGLRQRLVERGLAQSGRFDVHRTGRALLDALRGAS